MLAWADHLFAMTQGHLRLLESLELDVGPRPRLVSHRGIDVDDPLGGGPEIYQACAEQLLASLRERLPEFLEQ
jgi:protein-tyrosine-phosphatase